MYNCVFYCCWPIPHLSFFLSMQNIIDGIGDVQEWPQSENIAYQWYQEVGQTNHDKSSRKHAYIILTPLNSILYSTTGVYKGMHYFFLFLLKNIDCGYSLELPRISENFQFFGGEIFYIGIAVFW